MSSTKYRQIAGIVCLLGVLGIVFSLSRIIPLGMSGNIAQAKLYIVLMIVCFITSFPAGFVYEYNKNREEDPELEKLRIEIDILSKKNDK